ncbi:MAG: addiction module antidote protein [Magnetococcales bacterium]|nr:addiction module antidote protein [Magnetococcales bacterium]HIJ83040.1 putative addiction module antidote protein [Magnetococcales bacterium]
MRTSKSFDETRRTLLSDPKVAAIYLEECLQDGDMGMFTTALKHVADARGGVTLLSSAAHLNYETLYRTLSEDGNPRLSTLVKVLDAMGLRLGVVPADAHL